MIERLPHISVAEIVTWMANTRNGHLVNTFISFIIIQLVFAAIYFRLYRRRPERFSFNIDILQAKTVSLRSSAEESVVRLTRAAEALRELNLALDQGVTPVVLRSWGSAFQSATITLASGSLCQINDDRDGSVSTPAMPDSRFFIMNTDPSVLFISDLPMHTSLDRDFRQITEWQSVLPHIVANLERQTAAAQRRFTALFAPKAKVWSYWDFVYFSTIVQTTVGFGDILPNSTPVRMIVTMHILIGYALLVVVLNIVLSQ